MLELAFIILFLLCVGYAIDKEEKEIPHHNEGLSDEIYQDTGEGMSEK